jgi:molybdate transport system substrate-binding protein
MAKTLTVFAASALTEALTEIAELYKAAASDVTLAFNFDSSGKLQALIEGGTKADLFLSAGQAQMNALAKEHIDTETHRNFLVNSVVLAVPKGSAKGIASFQDCLTDKVSRVALGKHGVAVGQYSEEIFRFLDGWNKVLPKAVFGGNVKEVLSLVEGGGVDCGVIFYTDAATSKAVSIAARAPIGSHQPAVYPAAVLKRSENAAAAKAFLNYLGSPEALAVFEKIGFNTVGGRGRTPLGCEKKLFWGAGGGCGNP